MYEGSFFKDVDRYSELVAVANCKVPKSGSVVYEHNGKNSSYVRVTCLDRQNGSVYFEGVVDNVFFGSGRVIDANKGAFKKINLGVGFFS